MVHPQPSTTYIDLVERWSGGAQSFMVRKQAAGVAKHNFER